MNVCLSLFLSLIVLFLVLYERHGSQFAALVGCTETLLLSIVGVTIGIRSNWARPNVILFCVFFVFVTFHVQSLA